MLPVIQEQLLLIKVMQGLCQTLLCLALGYLSGEVLLSLPGRPWLLPAGEISSPTVTHHRPALLTSRRVGLLVALLMACNLVLMKIAYGASLLTGPFWRILTVLFVIGLALILAARQHLRGTRPISRLSLAAALLGDLMLLAICFFLLNAESRLLTPEVWPLLRQQPSLLLSWHGTVRFVQFSLLALMLAALDRRLNHKRLVFWAALLWIPAQLLEWRLVPELLRSPSLHLAASLSLAASVALAFGILSPLLQKKPLAPIPALAGTVLLAMLWVYTAQIARENSLAIRPLTRTHPGVGIFSRAMQT